MDENLNLGVSVQLKAELFSGSSGYIYIVAHCCAGHAKLTSFGGYKVYTGCTQEVKELIMPFANCV